MKKKLMMVAVLLGALTLGACVDDNESASVTAVRNAKAKQLESVAALNNANAEAAKILAAADAKLKEAEAAYQQALANAKENETTFLKEKYVLELQKIKAEYEADIARAKADAAKADREAWAEADLKLKKLYTAYSNAIDEVSELNGKLIDAKLDLAQIDIDAITGKVYWDNYVAKQNQTIAEKTAEIERLKALNVADKADLLKKMNDLSTTGYNLNKDKVVAKKVETDAEKAFNEAIAPTLPYKYFNSEQNHEQAAWMAVQLPYAKAVAALQDMEGTYRVYGKFVTSTSNEIVIDGCPELGTYKTYAPSASGDVMEATQTVTNALNGTINTIVANIGVPSVKDKSAATGTYLWLEQSEASLKTAKENLAAEQKKDAPNKDLIAQYTLDIENANINIEKANNQITSFTEDLAEAKADLKEFNDILATVKEGSAEQKAYAEAIKAIVPAGEAYLTATHKVHEIENAIAIIGINSFDVNGEPASWNNSGEYYSIKSLYDGVIDVATLIANCNAAIAEAKAKIASGNIVGGHYEQVSYSIFNPFTNEYEYRTTNVWVNDPTVVVNNEDAKKLAQLEIDALTAKIKVNETLVAKYKAELDAALAAE